MPFNSLLYLVFLPAVYLAYRCTRAQWRWSVLLFASYGFYAALKAPHLLVILVLVTLVSYACGLRLAASADEDVRKRWLWSGIAGCLAMMAAVKYLPALVPRTAAPSFLFESIGVSYFTFQAISYLIDLYLEVVEPERHLGYYALYLAFFPKLLEGPIERCADLLPQLRAKKSFDYDEVRLGIVLFAWGLFKKVVVADRFALFANEVFGNVHQYTGVPLWVGCYAYAFQLFFDFSGYTDMARGTGYIFGIRLTQNFQAPYLARSIMEFWRRWHISFSRWILDYLFKPLQLQWRGLGQWGTPLALWVTFLASGVWHGASWGYLVWGALHGTYLAASTWYRPYQKRLHQRLGGDKNPWLRTWQVLVTFNLVSFAWIFFRAGSLSDAWYVVRHLVVFQPLGAGSLKEYLLREVLVGQSTREALVLALVSLVLAGASWISRHGKGDWLCESLPHRPLLMRWALYYALVGSIVVFGIFYNTHFIYYRF